MISNFIDLKVFLIALAVGILYVYVSDDYKKVIILYPTPHNKDKYLYRDKANNCFKYELEETNCPVSANEYIDVRAKYQ